jgi:hypothetical protein
MASCGVADLTIKSKGTLLMKMVGDFAASNLYGGSQ